MFPFFEIVHVKRHFVPPQLFSRDVLVWPVEPELRKEIYGIDDHL